MPKKLDYKRKTEIRVPRETKVNPGYLPGDKRGGHQTGIGGKGVRVANPEELRKQGQADLMKLINRHAANAARSRAFHQQDGITTAPTHAPSPQGMRIPEGYVYRAHDGKLYKKYSDADLDQWYCAVRGLCTPARLPLTGGDRRGAAVAAVKVAAGVGIVFTILGILLSL